MATFKLKLILIFLLASCLYEKLSAQPTWTLDPFGKEKKPEQYEEKLLASEKTGDKKFTNFRRIIQNNTTHYNYYFNATNKLNAVIERAKLAQKDDYSQLLSFYPYSLESTAQQKTELDSVIYKATAGILLHDLRSDWVDNMYLLIGKSYYFRKEFDSAALTFQFINYNLFPRKKNEDDDRIVGTNDESGRGTLSIANKEHRNLAQKALSLPPSRNDALIWLTRTFIDQGAYGDAAGMLNILQGDPNLPARLKNDLEEMTGYWFFAQNNLDSSAVHLEKALTNADTKQDKSRREFLLAQLYEINGKYEQASEYYVKVSKHTTDPVMDIYARLNDAKMMRNSGNTKELKNSIDNLLKMARKDKFENYRDIIYYSTGQLLLQMPDTTNAIVSYGKSVKYKNAENPLYKNKSFLQLAEIAYVQKSYTDAYRYYDSLDLTEKSLADRMADITSRKETLGRIVASVNAIQKEDSLQLIAAMAPADRDAFIKKLVKKYRKEQGLKEEDNGSGTLPITFNSKNDTPTDLFASGSKSSDWYFYNTGARGKGYSEFRAKWGKRDNVDNWRRKSAVESAMSKSVTNGTGNYDDPDKTGLGPVQKPGAASTSAVPFSYDALMNDVPLSPEKIDSSNATIAGNLLSLAALFQNELQDYGQAIDTYMDYLKRFPDSDKQADVYLGLYFCYAKLGDLAKADYYKNIVTAKYSGTAASNKLLNPALLEPNKKNPEVTARYEAIYNLFIEGKFEEAIAAKQTQDAMYGTNYWTPQLLYIEAVYNIRQRNDSGAILVLKKLEQLYPASPLKPKATSLIDVLGRRAAIEQYLTNLDVTRAEEDKVMVADDKPVTAPPVAITPVTTPKVIMQQPAVIKPGLLNDSIIKTPAKFINGAFTLHADKPQYVAMILDKVDGVYINEAKNAFNRFNKESYYTQNIVITRDAIDGERTLLLFSPFEDAEKAIAYYDKIRKAAPGEVSWLQASKYSFMIISDDNLQVLKQHKDLPAYIQLLKNNFDNKF